MDNMVQYSQHNDKIQFNFTYYAMKLLGKNLYSNPWTAISEIVANGIDSGAPNVYVLVDMRDKEHAIVEIFDDGSGMSYVDLCEKYTLIGRNKRESIDNITGKTLGRKGIGKLAALYLSPKYYLITKTKNENSCWVVDTTQFRDSDIPTLNRIERRAVNIVANYYWEKCPHGTLIHLTNVNLTRIGEERLKSLFAILSDYYLSDHINSVIKVCVLTEQKSPVEFLPIKKDICFETMCGIFDNTTNRYSENIPEYVYLQKKEGIEEIDEIKVKTTILDTSKYACDGLIELRNLKGETVIVPYKLTGWIGIQSSLDKKVLQRNTDNIRKLQMHPNALRLYVRGKLAVNDLMTYIGSSQAFANYIEGEISFDILDDDDFEDASTSNREGYSLGDRRVQKLLEIVRKIITSLISERVRMGSESNRQRDQYFEKLRLEEERRKKVAEALAEQERQARVQTEEELKKTTFDLNSEKRRNIFLNDSLSEDQLSYTKKLHMIRINNATIQNIVDILVLKKRQCALTADFAWENIKQISYCNARIKSVLDYCAKAKFDPKDETISGDLFEFIAEYCEKISKQVCADDGDEINIQIDNASDEYVRQFVPQDIGVLIENVISNSIKNKASKIIFKMYSENKNYYIDISDDGRGLDSKANAAEIFEFGKSYTKKGTGVGLYHVKLIVENMNGQISLIQQDKGFGLRIILK